MTDSSARTSEGALVRVRRRARPRALLRALTRDRARSRPVARDLAPCCARVIARRDSSSGRPGRADAARCSTVDRVRRSRLRPGELPGAYRWYDRPSGTIDLVALALDSMTGVRARPALDEPPPWIVAASLPTHLPDASLSTLAELSGRACRAWVDAGRPGLDATTRATSPVHDPSR
jgi:hypothetical protein